MDAAQITIIADAEAGFGLSFFYFSAVDVEIMAALAVSEVAAAVAAVAAVVVTTTTAVNGLLFFLFSSAAAETMVPAANFFTGVCL